MIDLTDEQKSALKKWTNSKEILENASKNELEDRRNVIMLFFGDKPEYENILQDGGTVRYGLNNDYQLTVDTVKTLSIFKGFKDTPLTEKKRIEKVSLEGLFSLNILKPKYNVQKKLYDNLSDDLKEKANQFIIKKISIENLKITKGKEKNVEDGIDA